MAEFEVIKGSDLPTAALAVPDGYIMYLTPLGGDLYRTEKVLRANFLKIARNEIIDFTADATDDVPLMGINASSEVFLDATTGTIYYNIAALEIRDGSGFLVSGYNDDGQLVMVGKSPGIEVAIQAENVDNDVIFNLPYQASTDKPVLNATPERTTEIQVGNATTDTLPIDGNRSLVQLAPTALANAPKLGLPSTDDIDEQFTFIIKNTSAFNITNIDWVLSGVSATNGDLPTDINAGTTAHIMLGANATWWDVS